jgi:hypothetical protein
MSTADRPHVAPSRDGVVIDPFGDITVPDKPRSWPKWRYLATYDEDPVTVWMLYTDGARAVFTVRGPLSARAVVRSLRPGTLHLAQWGRRAEGKPIFPMELVDHALLNPPPQET